MGVFMLTNLLSYCYILIAGRQLSPSEFGAFNALLGVITIGAIFATSLQVAVTRMVSERLNNDSFVYLQRVSLQLAVLGMATVGVGGLLIGSHVQFGALQIAMCALTLALMVFGSAATGFLVAAGNIQSQANLAFWGTLARIGVGWPLLLLGFGVSAALAGYATHYALILVLAYVGCRRALPSDSHTPPGHAPLQLDRMSMAIFILSFAPFTLDQLLVQYLNPAVGGAYAASATIAKLVFFASYPITALAYPGFLLKAPGRDRVRALAVATAAVFGIAAILTLLIELFAEPVITLFFGARFGGIGEQLRLMAPAALCFSLTALGIHAQIAWRPKFGIAAPLAALLVGLLLYQYNHQSFNALASNQLTTLLLQMLLVWTVLLVTILLPLRRNPSVAQP